MTPLARFLSRILPARLAIAALTLAYSGMMLAILVAGEVERTDIIYIDVRGD